MKSAEVSSNDMSWLLLASLRYSLGRQSYAPSLTSEIIQRHRRILTADQAAQMVKEIREHLRLTFYGVGFQDIPRTWETLAAELEKTDAR